MGCTDSKAFGASAHRFRSGEGRGGLSTFGPAMVSSAPQSQEIIEFRNLTIHGVTSADRLTD